MSAAYEKFRDLHRSIFVMPNPWDGASSVLLAREGFQALASTSLGIAFAAVFSKVQPMVFGETTATRLPHPPALLPVFVHLALALLLGLYIPEYLATWYREAARLIG